MKVTGDSGVQATLIALYFISSIQDVAEPVAISTISVRLFPQPFQKFSNALTKLERCVSIQGISSMNMTFLRLEGRVSR